MVYSLYCFYVKHSHLKIKLFRKRLLYFHQILILMEIQQTFEILFCILKYGFNEDYFNTLYALI